MGEGTALGVRLAGALARRGLDQFAAAARLDSEVSRRIGLAAIELVGRWGVRKTTIADIAQRAGCSRATVYRVFPDGKRQVLLAAGAARLEEFLADMAAVADRAASGEDVLVGLLSTAARELADDAAFQFLLHHEHDVLLPFLGFAEQGRLFGLVRTVIGPHLEPHLGEQAGWTAEWCARILLSYLFNPSDELDLTRPANARLLVRRFLLPALAPRVPVPA
ncbi:MAG TPA: TetR/AcrR family transcriptional regulator [Acidimicrobiales bacterium]|jgi:AcrR family transcriptional regulator|nr:TetR/AcrR family transcriptional regulator [Acidimicrobiales bacterium]